MAHMNWIEEVEKRKDDLLKDTQAFLQIKSVLDEESRSEFAPFGEGINEAFTHLLSKGEEEGFTIKNLDGYAGYLEIGDGEEIVGVLCHVDVVPEGDGWSSDPYAAEIREGSIYARGAMDDKGPTMAAFYAMKIVKELGLPLSKRVRMIIGTDEESEWRCVEHYFKHEEMPALGFAPDADFPIIFAEKGIIDAKLTQQLNETEEKETAVLISFQSGRRFNMVPDFATATIKAGTELEGITQTFNEYLAKLALTGEVISEGEHTSFSLKGVSAHAMEPNNGKNAGILLATFLKSVTTFDSNGGKFIRTINEFFTEDTRGEKLGISYKDEISGELTVNLGVMSYSSEEGGELGVNLRYPVTGEANKVKASLESIPGFSLTSFNDSKPHHVDANTPLIKTLQKVYEEQTGEKAELLSIGGGTYARSLEAGVAFGPLFPGRPDVAHQKDEYIAIDDLVKATAIYAQAIYELAK
ncbi:dipeptidase PepV [Metabacillus herbersteinensis]|uniref:Dipeptidase PepV n=1 Tax=Metabacillus herbersteinensis TaxID=283816 RepID=A0ABV6GLC7_9BACI